MIDIKALKQAAINSGGHEWVCRDLKIYKKSGSVNEVIADPNSGRNNVGWEDERLADFYFIECSNPKNILQLIERLENAEERLRLFDSTFDIIGFDPGSTVSGLSYDGKLLVNYLYNGKTKVVVRIRERPYSSAYCARREFLKKHSIVRRFNYRADVPPELSS